MKRVERVDVSVYRIPTATPESDGTFEWDHTDLVVVEGNPLHDLACLENVRAVMKAGRWVTAVPPTAGRWRTEVNDQLKLS